MSRPTISSQERKGIIVLLAIITGGVLSMSIKRCIGEQRAQQMWETRAAYNDSISSLLIQASDSSTAPDTSMWLRKDSLRIKSGGCAQSNSASLSGAVVNEADSFIVTDRKGRKTARKSKSRASKRSGKTQPPVPRSPIDEPVN